MPSLYDGGGRSNLSVTETDSWDGGGGGGGDGIDGGYMMPKRDPLYIVVPMTVVYSVIFVTGVIGNTITCMVIAKHKYMHTATNYYLFSLAVSDLILLVSGLPQEMWSIWSRYPYIFGELFCQLRGLFAEMSANATVLTITAFTAERYVAICHPFMAQSMSKLSRAVKLIVIIWLVAALFAIPQALQFTVSAWNGMQEMTQCNIRTIQLMYTDVELSTVSFTVSTVLFFVLPMTVITVLYALIGLRLRRTDRLKRTITVRSSAGEKKNASSPEYRANSSSKVLKMLVAVVVAFFICWAPFHAQRLIAIFGSNHASSGDADADDIPFLHQLYGVSTYVSGILYYVSTTINPILYHIMSLKFRAAFKETVLRCCGGGSDGRWRTGYDGSIGGGGGGRRRPHWRRKRRDGGGHSSVVGAADERRQKYRRVSGRTSSSVERPWVDDDDVGGGGGPTGYAVTSTVDRRSSPVVGLADCWRRTLMGRSSGGVGDGGFGAVVGDGSSAQREMSTGSTAAGDEDDGGSIAAPPSASQLRSPPPSQLPPPSSVTAAAALSSNWTVISNSSLSVIIRHQSNLLE